MPSHARAWKDWRITGASTNSKAFRYLVFDGNSERLIEVDWPKDLDWTNGLKPIERPQEELAMKRRNLAVLLLVMCFGAVALAG